METWQKSDVDDDECDVDGEWDGDVDGDGECDDDGGCDVVDRVMIDLSPTANGVSSLLLSVVKSRCWYWRYKQRFQTHNQKEAIINRYEDMNEDK